MEHQSRLLDSPDRGVAQTTPPLMDGLSTEIQATNRDIAQTPSPILDGLSTEIQTTEMQATHMQLITTPTISLPATIPPPGEPRLLYQVDTAPTTFHPMKRLPTEIQLRIYEIADDQFTPARTISTLPKTKGNQTPVMFHVCRISRLSIIKKYARFQTIVKIHPIQGLVHYAYFMNMAIDSLIIDSEMPGAYRYISQAVGIERFGDACRVFPRLMKELRFLTLSQAACELQDDISPEDMFVAFLLGAPKLALRTLMAAAPLLEGLTVVLGKRTANEMDAVMDGGNVDPTGYVI